MVLWWTYSCKSTFFLYWSQNWTQYSKRSFTSTEQRKRIISLDLLAKVLLMQPKISQGFCQYSTCPQVSQNPVLRRCFPAESPSACIGALSLSPPVAGLCISPLCSSDPNSPGLSGWQCHISRIPHSFVSSMNVLRVSARSLRTSVHYHGFLYVQFV